MNDSSDAAIRLKGLGNFRNLGGLVTVDGRSIRPHALMRADRLAGLDRQGWQWLAGTGIATICDLRSAAEREEHPNAVPGGLQIRERYFEISNDLRADPELARLLAADPSASGAQQLMIEIYRRFPGYMGGTLRAITGLAIEGGAPLLVHCSAGKDRTGFVIAMLLHALGVPAGPILADYLASRDWPGAEAHRASLATRLGQFVPQAALAGAVDTVLDVREVYLDAAFEAIVREFGSLDRYLEVAAGLDAARRDLLRDALLMQDRPRPGAHPDATTGRA